MGEKERKGDITVELVSKLGRSASDCNVGGNMQRKTRRYVCSPQHCLFSPHYATIFFFFFLLLQKMLIVGRDVVSHVIRAET